MDLKLDGKNAVVCGSTQGIGKASAIELALLGADITLIARDEKKLKAVVKDLPVPLGQKHDYLVADFNFPEQLQSGLEKHFSKETFHILVNKGCFYIFINCKFIYQMISLEYKPNMPFV